MYDALSHGKYEKTSKLYDGVAIYRFSTVYSQVLRCVFFVLLFLTLLHFTFGFLRVLDDVLLLALLVMLVVGKVFKFNAFPQVNHLSLRFV